jgi:hypothetical protein
MSLPLFSHGSEYAIMSDRVIKIEIKYDTGEFFTDTDVLVFPPGESEPVYTLKTDEKGCFYFMPDKEGEWILQVRGEEGHGRRINLTVNKSMLTEGANSSRLNFVQKLIMVLCVAWGTAGTVLYFRNRI